MALTDDLTGTIDEPAASEGEEAPPGVGVSGSGGGPGGWGRGGWGPGGFGGPGGHGGRGDADPRIPGGPRDAPHPNRVGIARGGGRRGGRAGRGDVRAAILLLLDEAPMHGYQLIRAIAERTDGIWTPSPGSMYPALAALEDECLIVITRVEGRKTASLTPAGEAFVQENRAALGEPWDDVGGAVNPTVRSLRELAGAVKGAALRVAETGSDAQAARAATVLQEARTALHLILTEDEAPNPTPTWE